MSSCRSAELSLILLNVSKIKRGFLRAKTRMKSRNDIGIGTEGRNIARAIAVTETQVNQRNAEKRSTESDFR